MQVINQQTWWRPFALMLSFMLIISSALTAGVPVKVQAAANTIYVSATGDDTAAGTEDAPVATLNKAREKVLDHGTIILLSDITVDEMQVMGESKTVTIQSEDGEMYSIIRSENFPDKAENYLLSISTGTYTFKNLIIDGNKIEYKAAHAINVNSTAIFENVIIQNHYNIGSNGTAVLSVSKAGTFATIKGTTEIKGNTLTGTTAANPPSILGAGSGGNIIIEGGLITNNTVMENSNGVIVGLGSAGTPSFTMTGGAIKDNHLKGNGENVDSKTIGNVAVYMRGTSAQAKFKFEGTAYVYDNITDAGVQRNVFLNNTAAINTAYLSLIGAMSEGAKVGVFANVMPSESAPIVDVAIGLDGYIAQENDAKYFHSDIETSAKVKLN